jgi:hypothetical protein
MRPTAPAMLTLALLSVHCAPPLAHDRAALSSSLQPTTKESSRCDYALEGALGLGGAVALIGIMRDRPAEQLAYMVPVGLGLGWLWGRLLMPRRSHCRALAGTATQDSMSLHPSAGP